MLINLTNHPAFKWPAEQTAYALSHFGSVAELPFPQVAPEASKEDIRSLASDYVERIRVIASPEEAAVLVAGEVTFVYAIVGMLQQLGYTCLASTSVREAVEDADGKKLVTFHFHSMREY